MARPTVDLDWAENDVVDPTSGQNNKVEPPAAWKNNGWGYQEKPPRNYDNYHKWNTGQWVKYLDTAIGRACTLKVAASDATAESQAHADYVCDGTADQTEINAAITAAATTGGLVLLSEGTFVVDGAINLDTNVHVKGMGIGCTTIQVSGSASTDFSIMSASSKSRLSVSGLTVNGNATAITQNHIGIALASSSHINIRDVEITSIDRDSSDGFGIEIDGCSYVYVNHTEVTSCVNIGIVVTGTCHTIEFNTVTVDNCGAFGFSLGADYITMVNCTSRANANSGLTLSGSYCKVIGCTFRSNATGDGISLLGSYSLIAGCVIDHNDYHGIATTGATDNNICDNIIVQNGQDTHATYDGIYISDGSSDWNTITDNKIRRGTSSPQQRYGINLAGSADNYVYGNDVVAGGITSNISATGRTIPEWVGSAAGTNNQDDVTKANRIA